MKHEILEKNVGLLSIFMVIAVVIGGLTQIVPLFFQDVVNEPVEGMKPYTALQLEGRHLHPRRLQRLPLADDPSVPCRNRALRPLLRRRRERLGPPVPGGFQANRSGPAPRGRWLPARRAPPPPVHPAQRGARCVMARLSVA